MNVFWNVKSLYKKDKRRFNKQILELATIWKAIYANITGTKAGYQNHPVVKFYENNLISLWEISCNYGKKNSTHKSWLTINKYQWEINKLYGKYKLKIGKNKKCFVAKKTPRHIKILCKIVDFFSTTLAYEIYCRLYKWKM